MLAIAGTIVERRTGKFDPSEFRDRYQEALRELIEAKMKGLPIKPREVATPAPVIDLMAALKHSLAQEMPASARGSVRGIQKVSLAYASRIRARLRLHLLSTASDRLGG